MPDLGSVCPHALGSCVRGCASGPECSRMSPWTCVCPVCRSVGEGAAVGQGGSVCAAVSICLCMCVCVYYSCVSMCPQAVSPMCVRAVSVSVCPYVCVSATQTVCFSAASESSSACPAGVLATVVATSISHARPFVRLSSSGGAGQGAEGKGEERGSPPLHPPPPPAPTPSVPGSNLI